MAFNININRLNLPNMVDRQLKDTVVPTETYFNPLIIMGRRKSLELKQRRMPVNNNSNNNMSSSLNSIMASVHKKLKTFKSRKVSQLAQATQSAQSAQPAPVQQSESSAVAVEKTETSAVDTPKSEPAKLEKTKPAVKFEKSKSDAATPVKAKSETAKIAPAKSDAAPKKATSELRPKSKSKSNVKSTFHYNLHQLRMPNTAKSISQIKASREIRSQQRLRRSLPRYEDSHVAATQKRIYEVKKQKRILEDMLQQHQKLQRDRHSIALEIQAMREHLSDIRNKLDVSLRKLSANHTMSERPVRAKRAQSAASGRLGSSPARNRQRPISVDRRLIKGT